MSIRVGLVRGMGIRPAKGSPTGRTAAMTAAVRDVLHNMTLAELTEKVGARGRGQMYYI